jgi:hypothetical protein
VESAQGETTCQESSVSSSSSSSSSTCSFSIVQVTAVFINYPMTVRKCNAHKPSSWLTERVSLATARHAVSSCPSLHEGLSVDARLRASCRLGSTQERRAAPGTKSRPEAERGTVRRVADTQGFARWGPALQSPSPSFTIYSFPGCRTRTARLVHSPVRAIGR